MASAERRYSRVSRCMWRDEKFRGLTKIKPSAQSLWIYLLTGPHCTSIPGLFVLGEAAMAEELGWPLAATQNAFAEIVRAEMAWFDKDTRLVWLPKAMLHNKPESPNVVTGWKKSWAELPKCKIRDNACEVLRGWCVELGESYARAFLTAVGEAPRQPSSNPSGFPGSKRPPKPSVEDTMEPSAKTPPIQDQEQEQEFDPRARTPAPAREANSGQPRVVDPDSTDPTDLLDALWESSDRVFDRWASVGTDVEIQFLRRLADYGFSVRRVRILGPIIAKRKGTWPTANIGVNQKIQMSWLMGAPSSNGQRGGSWLAVAVAMVEVIEDAEAKRVAARPRVPPAPSAPPRPDLIGGTPEFDAEKIATKARHDAMKAAGRPATVSSSPSLPPAAASEAV